MRPHELSLCGRMRPSQEWEGGRNYNHVTAWLLITNRWVSFFDLFYLKFVAFHPYFVPFREKLVKTNKYVIQVQEGHILNSIEIFPQIILPNIEEIII